MTALVMPLGILPSTEGDAYGVLALFPSGQIAVQLDHSWAAAGAKLARQLVGPVTCEASLTTVGARLGWKPVTPERHQLLLRAAITLAFAYELPPALTPRLGELTTAWARFYELALWEDVPGEVAFTVVRRRGQVQTEHAIAVLGQAGEVFGLAWYEQRDAFHAVWSGTPISFDGFSVLADDSAFLAPAFEPFGVPPLAVTRIVGARAFPPDAPTVELAWAALTLLVRLTQGVVEPLALPDGSTLALVLPEPAAPAPKKQPAKKKPAAKKPVTKKPVTKTKPAAKKKPSR